MKRLKAWLLRRLIRDRIIFGTLHERDIEHIYHTVWMACRDEFSEDSVSSLRAYLEDRFDRACQDPVEKSTT
jgi:hypothetical protein